MADFVIGLVLSAGPLLGCFPGPIEVDMIETLGDDVSQETSTEATDGADICDRQPDLSGNAIVIGRGQVFPVGLQRDRAGQALVSGILSGAVELEVNDGPLVVTSEPDGPGVFWSIVPMAALVPSMTTAARGHFGALIGSTPLLSTISADDSLNVGLVFVVEEGSIVVDGPRGSVTVEPLMTPSVVVQQLDSSGLLAGSFLAHHAYGAPLAPASIGRRNGAVVVGFHARGPRVSLAAAWGGSDDYLNEGWADGDSPTTLVGRLSNGSRRFGSVGESVHHLPGVVALSVEPSGAPSRNDISILGVVTKTTTLPTIAGPLTIEPGPDLHLLELSDNGLLIHNTPIATDAASLVTPSHTLQQLLPTHRRRVDDGSIIIVPLRDGLRVGPGGAHVIDAPNRGLLIAAFDASHNVEWTRRIQWLSGNYGRHPDSAGFMFSDVVVSDNGAIVLGGVLTGELEVDVDASTTTRVTSSGADPDGWLVGFSRDGQLEFAFDAVRGPGRDGVTALARGQDGELLVTGYFEGPTTFGRDGSAGTIDAVSGPGAFLMRHEHLFDCH